MPVLMCFGDSNTWGTQPMADATDVRRYAPTQRWPGVLKAGLGPEWQLIEEGLPGRTLNRDDPSRAKTAMACASCAPCWKATARWTA